MAFEFKTVARDLKPLVAVISHPLWFTSEESYSTHNRVRLLSNSLANKLPLLDWKGGAKGLNENLHQLSQGTPFHTTYVGKSSQIASSRNSTPPCTQCLDIKTNSRGFQQRAIYPCGSLDPLTATAPTPPHSAPCPIRNLILLPVRQVFILRSHPKRCRCTPFRVSRRVTRFSEL
ncbi:hypothetical protein CEXT_665251 [Caerostris extrusa]|uniref:Uncharacterized protein n=1 Tax=Caerostris extrusa TaxID=172846 RepID=A0AAV4NEK5_CAEEX|nr:hypothetical protein CEXT_665251 [Caerostris extrusa]